MGEVYRARDAKLDRDVALKLLPDAFAQDPDRLARFEREATTLAVLNHPNIGSIYGLEKSPSEGPGQPGCARARARAGRRPHAGRSDRRRGGGATRLVNRRCAGNRSGLSSWSKIAQADLMSWVFASCVSAEAARRRRSRSTPR
jgi:serine/threonine protein kinase